MVAQVPFHSDKYFHTGGKEGSKFAHIIYTYTNTQGSNAPARKRTRSVEHYSGGSGDGLFDMGCGGSRRAGLPGVL